MSQDIFMYLRWKAVQSVVAVQTLRDMFTAFVQVSEESCFTPQVQVHPMAWAEVTQSVRWGVSYISCATAYSEPLALTEGGFFVCQSFTEIHCGRISLFIPTPTPISVWILPTFLLGPWPVSNRVRNLLAWRPLVQIQSMLVWPRKKNDPLADHSVKMDLLSAFQWHTSRTITQTNPAGTGTEMEAWTVSWIQMETSVTQPWIYQSTYSHTSFSAV